MSSNEYPEHLNPFKDGTKPKTKLGLRSSFSRLTRPLRQSFRKIIKDDQNNDVTIRKRRTNDFPRYSNSTSTQNVTPVFPRSRIHERMTNSCSESSANPFDDADQDDSNLDIDSLQRNTLRRKTKKKAPLPPKSLSNEHLNDNSLHAVSRASHWSLTSAETDYSEEPEQNRRSEGEDRLAIDEVIEITKGLEKLIDDSNNNNLIDEKQHEIPDIVVSCANSGDSSKDNKQAVIRRLSEAEIQDSSLGTHLENKSIIVENGNNKEVGESSGENDGDDDDDELVVTDITHNLIQDGDKHTPNGDVDAVEKTCGTNEEHQQNGDLNYNEKKSIYIAGSRDELNNSDSYCDKISIYINSSIEAIDRANNNNSNSEAEEDVTDLGDQSAPVPKLRKNKLTKRELLGA